MIEVTWISYQSKWNIVVCILGVGKGHIEIPLDLRLPLPHSNVVSQFSSLYLFIIIIILDMGKENGFASHHFIDLPPLYDLCLPILHDFLFPTCLDCLFHWSWFFGPFLFCVHRCIILFHVCLSSPLWNLPILYLFNCQVSIFLMSLYFFLKIKYIKIYVNEK